MPIRLWEKALDDPLALRWTSEPAETRAETLRSWHFDRGNSGWLILDEQARLAHGGGGDDAWRPRPLSAAVADRHATRFPTARGALITALPMAAQRLLRVVARVRRAPTPPGAAEPPSDRAMSRLYVQPTLHAIRLERELASRSYLEIALDPSVQILEEPLLGSAAAPSDGEFHDLVVTLATPGGTQGLTLLFGAGDGSCAAAVDLESVRIEELPLRERLALDTLPGARDEKTLKSDDALAAELGVLAPPDRTRPMLRKVEHLLEQRDAVLLPPPSTCAIEIELEAGEWQLEYGIARVHEARRSFARCDYRVALRCSIDGSVLSEQVTCLAAGNDAAGWFDRTASIDVERPSRLKIEFAVDRGNNCDDIVAIGAPLLRRRGRCDGRRNLIIVSLDTVRADHLSAHGYPRPTTPFLDQLAAESAWFRCASSTSSYTLPAHASLFTGQHPTRHGAHSESAGRNRIRSDRSDLLAVQLRDAGWLTAAFTGGVYLRANFGFAQGFDRYDMTDLALPLDTDRARKLPRPGDPGFNERYRRQRPWEHALNWIRTHADAPFFLFLHTYIAHEYVASPEHEARFLSSCQSNLARGDLRFVRDLTLTAKPTAADMQRYIDAYDATLREADARIGELLEVLRQTALDERTVVVVVSDHGEEFLDHGGVNHGRTLYEEMVRVPLLMRVPGSLPREIDAPVSLLDVSPTLVELFGLAATHPQDGRSLLALIEGGALPQRPIVAEIDLEPRNRWSLRREGSRVGLDARDERAASAIAKSGHPRARGRRMTFNTVADPRQTRDLTLGTPEEEEAAAELLDAIDGQREDARDRREAARRGPTEESTRADRFDVFGLGGYVQIPEGDDDAAGEDRR